MKKLCVIALVAILATLLIVPASAAGALSGDAYYTLPDGDYNGIEFPSYLADYTNWCVGYTVVPGTSTQAIVVFYNSYSWLARFTDSGFGVYRSSLYTVYDSSAHTWSEPAAVPTPSLVYYFDYNDSFVFNDVAVVRFDDSSAEFPLNRSHLVRLTMGYGVLDVVSDIGSAIPALLLAVLGIFWNGGRLTVLGILAVCALSVSLVLLFAYLISRFLQLRG